MWTLIAFQLCFASPGDPMADCRDFVWTPDEMPPTLDTQEQCKTHARYVALSMLKTLGVDEGDHWVLRSYCLDRKEERGI